MRWPLSIIALLLLLPLAECDEKVRLTDVKTLTLSRGAFTTARRGSPIPQVECVGGPARGRFEPRVVQCYNRGFDGIDVQWECKAEMPNDYEFGALQVSCEGYSYPEDPFVLKGSCGLQYNLEYSQGGSTQSESAKRPSAPEQDKESGFVFWLSVALVLFFVYLVYTTCTAPSEGREGDRNRGSGSSWDGGPWPQGPPGGGAPPPGFKTPFSTSSAPPPSYEESCRGPSSSSGTSRSHGGQTQDSGPGFFTGLGLGGLGGYLYGRMNREDENFRRRGPSQYETNTGFYSSGPSTSHTYSSTAGQTTTRTTSGFGGTTRR